jgi:hypothetical protein
VETGRNTFVICLEPWISCVGLPRLLVDPRLHLILSFEKPMLHHSILLEGLEMRPVVWLPQVAYHVS